MPEIELAQKAISELLSVLQINEVICVDDIYDVTNPDNSIALIIEWFLDEINAGKRNECGELIGEPDFFLIEDDEIWIRRLRDKWNQLDGISRESVISNLAALKGLDYDVARDKSSASLLKDVIPNGKLRELSPSKWVELSRDILTSARDTEGLLCLFDYNLVGAQGFPNNGGITLLSQAISLQENRPIIFGILTYTVKEGEELDRSDEFANNHKLKREDFLVLSKDRLQSPISFADGLKMMSINHNRDRLTWLVKNIEGRAAAEANKGLMLLDVYNFDHMVLKSSEKEGVWEAETLFRLFEIFRREAFQEETVKDENRLQLEDAIVKIRKIREIRTIEDHQIPENQRLTLRRKELYDSETYINKGHLPLELGDIFKINGKYYILIAQPCDLMIRSEGASEGKRKAQSVTLARISVPDMPEKLDPLFNYLIEYYDPDSFKHAVVKFQNTCHIAPEVLDLAVYSDDGCCRFPPPSDIKLLNVPWRKHINLIMEFFAPNQQNSREILANLNGLSEPNKQFLNASIISMITRSNLFITMNQMNETYEFNIQRVGRYRQPGASRLLSHYVAFLARDAIEHDFNVV